RDRWRLEEGAHPDRLPAAVHRAARGNRAAARRIAGAWDRAAPDADRDHRRRSVADRCGGAGLARAYPAADGQEDARRRSRPPPGADADAADLARGERVLRHYRCSAGVAVLPGVYEDGG